MALEFLKLKEHPDTDEKGMVEIHFALSGASSVSGFYLLLNFKLKEKCWPPANSLTPRQF